MHEITIKVPGKLMILGEHAVVYGYPCIVAAVNKYLYLKGTIKATGGDDLKKDNINDDRFIKAAVNIVKNKYKIKNSLSIETESGLTGFGLGSSAAVTVATIKLLDSLFELDLTDEDLFKLSYYAVLENQKKASGFDIASVIYGNTIYFNGRTKRADYISKDKLPMIVAFSGKKEDTPFMVERVSKSRRERPEFVNGILSKMGKLVPEGKRDIEEKNWRMLGEIMNENQKLLVKLGVSTDVLDRFIKAALRAGAYGAKISGAGGGDCLIALVNNKKKESVIEAIKNAGGEIIKLSVGQTEGVITYN